MKVLIACEESGTVRDAFTKLGFDATSCDILTSRTPGKHHQGSIFEILTDGWDLMVAFPPCTHLCVSGAKHFEQKRKDGRQKQGINFFLNLAHAPIPFIAIENPIGIMSNEYRKPDQIIQPYQFGDPVKKTTCLWLKYLPLLKPTLNVESDVKYYTSPTGKKMSEFHAKQIVMDGKKYGYHTDEFKKHRSKTFQGIADAMARQWGDFLLNSKGIARQNSLFEL